MIPADRAVERHWSQEPVVEEPLGCYTPANWGALHHTSQRLLSQWVVIDFCFSLEARYPSVQWTRRLSFCGVGSNNPAGAANGVHKRRCAVLHFCGSPPSSLSHHFLTRSLFFLSLTLKFAAPYLFPPWNGIRSSKRNSVWIKYLHSCALSCAGAVSEFMEVAPTAPHRLFYVVSSLTGVCLCDCSSPQVDKVCGLSTKEPTSTQPTSPEVTTSTVTLSSPLPSVAPSKPSPEHWQQNLAHLRR